MKRKSIRVSPLDKIAFPLGRSRWPDSSRAADAGWSAGTISRRRVSQTRQDVRDATGNTRTVERRHSGPARTLPWAAFRFPEPRRHGHPLHQRPACARP